MQPEQLFDFQQATTYIKNGLAVSRENIPNFGFVSETKCNDPVPAEKIWSPHNRAEAMSSETQSVKVQPYWTIYKPNLGICMYVPTWDDIYAEDWYIVKVP